MRLAKKNRRDMTMKSNKIDCKLIFCPSNPPKIAENDRGIWRRISLEPMKKGQEEREGR